MPGHLLESLPFAETGVGLYKRLQVPEMFIGGKKTQFSCLSAY